MMRFSCFSFLNSKKKSSKKVSSQPLAKKKNGYAAFQVNPESVDDNSSNEKLDSTSFRLPLPYETGKNSTVGDTVDNYFGHAELKGQRLKDKAAKELAYEAGDEDGCDQGSPDVESPIKSEDRKTNSHSDLSVLDSVVGEEAMESGHVSDPGVYARSGFFTPILPMLKRSCSNLEAVNLDKMNETQLTVSQSQSFDDLQILNGSCMGGGIQGFQGGSPLSVLSSNSADKVMLKRLSSTHVLPSRSRKLWWKLFLWSHRNLHRPQQQPAADENSVKKDGYSSEILDIFEHANKDNVPIRRQNDGVPESWRCNQWMAFSAEPSSQNWVEDWVNSIDNNATFPVGDDVEDELNAEEAPTASPKGPRLHQVQPSSRHSNLPEEFVYANSLIRSMKPLSTVAHVSGMGLKTIPMFSAFSSLRTINLSGNFIAQITPGSLPKSLHTLNLSKNRIANIEGLRELTRLRILDLSYNRISKIGHGLSNCMLIKELYLTGNKISDIEGLHRLLKLTVLDLSFNKIITTKALGQLVANYNTLAAINLVGNPVQTNVGDELLRKSVSSLLPKLAYLNKQPIKPVRAREAANDSVAKAALGNGGRNTRRRTSRRTSQGSTSANLWPSSRSRHSNKQRGSNRNKGGSDRSVIRR